MLTLCGKAVARQVRCAIGHGGPGYKWKKTLLGNQYRREGPVKRRLQQHEYGRKMNIVGSTIVGREDGVQNDSSGGRASLRSMPTNVRDFLMLYGVHNEQELPGRYLIDPGVGTAVAARLGAVKDKHILIVGCGAGMLAKCLLERGVGCVTGVDIDETWIPLYEEMKQRFPGRFAYAIGDALTMDFTEVLGREGTPVPEKRSWTDEPTLVLLSSLPPRFHKLFWMRVCADISHHRGVYSYGRIPFCSIVDTRWAEAMAAMPANEAYAPQSVQRAAYFEVETTYKLPLKAYVGVDAMKKNTDTMVLLEPKVVPSTMPVERLFKASEALILRRSKQGKSRENYNLVDLLSNASTRGKAQAVLDLTKMDGGSSIFHLTEAEVVKLTTAFIQINYNNPEAQQEVSDVSEEIEQGLIREKSNRAEKLAGWDPLLDIFLEKQQQAASW